MTDGIIQQVFNERIKAFRILGYERDYCSATLEAIQQELIEKIKQEIKKASPRNSPEINTIWVNWILNKLIGDNK